MLTQRIGSLGIALLLSLGAGTATADIISDTLTVTDTAGLYNVSGSLTEAQEMGPIPGRITLTVPAVTMRIGMNENGSNMDSDTLTIPEFIVTLDSDADSPQPVPDLPELMTFRLNIFAGSDATYPPATCAPAVSDCLVVGNQFMAIDENANGADNPTAAMVVFPGTFLQFPSENGTPSDGLTVNAFTVTLTSDSLPESGPNLSESFSDTLIVTAASDVPEPSTMIPVTGISVAAAGLGIWRRRRAV